MVRGWVALAAGGRVGLESQEHGEGPAPPAGALQRGVGPGGVVGRRPLLVVAFVPDPSSLSSPGGNHRGLAVSSRITCCCGAETPGRTPPVRNDCASTADSDEGSGTTPPVGRGSRASCLRTHRRVCVAKWTPFTPQGWCPGSLVAVGGRSQAGRAGGVKPGVSAPQQRVIRLDTTGPACFRQATTATRDPGQRRPQAATAAQQRDPAPPPVAERPPEALLLIFGAHQTRPPAAHLTRAQ